MRSSTAPRRRRGPQTAFWTACALAAAAAPAAGAEPSAGGAVGPASAQQCSAGTMCVWSGTRYSGAFAETDATVVRDTGLAVARSVRNRTPFAARLYSEPDGQGSWTCVDPYESRAATYVPAESMRILVTTSC
ncbi:peptidase inhibitor family I36 protein [Cellulomonas gilvus]|uniref:Peptidase inhibitor family I36 n=1 Tax=Cellulomonas gilvus (strain ATCC 13127 / NRRL B-14078) TaxID=593907 RepID=F8A1Q3_CELGA|nr:hypothetical protein Celgi_1191 [Cellulomonas gilvus ATCC 13127]